MTIWRGTEGNVGSREIRTDVQVRRTTHVHDTDDLVYAPERPQWQTRAACRSVGSGVDMFPSTTDGIAAAVAVCAGCPVREQCADAARDERHGVWAGVPRDAGVFRCCGCGKWIQRQPKATATRRCSTCQVAARREIERTSKARNRKGEAA